MFYFPKGKTCYCEKCGQVQSARFEAMVWESACFEAMVWDEENNRCV